MGNQPSHMVKEANQGAVEGGQAGRPSSQNAGLLGPATSRDICLQNVLKGRKTWLSSKRKLIVSN